MIDKRLNTLKLCSFTEKSTRIKYWNAIIEDSDIVEDLMGRNLPLIFVRNIVVSSIKNTKNRYSIFWQISNHATCMMCTLQMNNKN